MFQVKCVRYWELTHRDEVGLGLGVGRTGVVVTVKILQKVGKQVVPIRSAYYPVKEIRE